MLYVSAMGKNSAVSNRTTAENPTRRGLAIVPSTWLGRGQLLYFLLLWAFVIGNFGRQLADFKEGRLLTEGMILLNAVFATLLILLLRQRTD